MANVVYSGYLDNVQQTLPYVVIDTGETFANINDARARLVKIPQTSASGTSSTTAGSSVARRNLPNIWKDVGLNAKSDVVISGEQGIHISAGTISSSGATLLNSNGSFSIGYTSYANLYACPLPSFYIHTFTQTSSVSTTVTETVYSDGALLEFNSSASAYTKMFFSVDGAIYFVTTNASYLGAIAPNSTSYTHIGMLNQLKMYCIRAFASNAYGTVTNTIGQPAPNFRIMAHRRSDGKLVGKGVTDADGKYAIDLSALKGDQLYMVCLDDDGVTPDFEAQIIDRVTV